MPKSPHIYFAGLIASCGLTLGGFAETVKDKSQTNKSIDVSSDVLNSDYSEVPLDNLSGQKNNKSASFQEVAAPPMELLLKADRQSYDARLKRYVAEGRVSAHLNGALLKADRIEFDGGFKTLLASGRVRFKKGFQYFQASSFNYSLIQRTGTLINVYGVVDLANIDKDLNAISKTIFPNQSSKQLQKADLLQMKKAKSLRPKNFFNQSEKSLYSFYIPEKGLDGSFSSIIPPLNSWRNPGDPFSFAPSSQKQFNKGDQLACPPALAHIPDWNPHPWAFTAWGGAMTDSDFGDSFIFGGDLREEYLFGIGLNKRFYKNGPFALEFEADWFRHIASKQKGGAQQPNPFAETSAQSFWEGVIGVGARLWLQPWLNIGFIEGVSYKTSTSNYERTNRDKHSKLLNYLGAEIEAVVSKKLSLVARIHHRSGAFGTFGGVKGGSNAYLIGFRYRWGKDERKEQPINLPPPAECSQENLKVIGKNQSIDDTLEVIALNKLPPFPRIQELDSLVTKTQVDPKFSLSITSTSTLSIIEQEKVRKTYIALIDQEINNISFQGSFSIQGKLGIQRLNNSTDGKNQIGSLQIPQLSPKAKSRFISGSIKRWRVQAAKIQINSNGWQADRMSFTNDPFTPTQTRIDAHDVVGQEGENGELLISSRKSRLIVEERLSIPIFNSIRIKKREPVENRWVVGIDQSDRDGLYVGRAFKPINLGGDYQLSLQPQFLIQRAIINKTNSYIARGSDVTSDKVSSSINASDLFGLKSKLRGNSFGYKVALDSEISTFNPDRILDGSRYWATLKKSTEIPFFNAIDLTFFGAYREKVWNGSIGETEIYTAYGGFGEQSINWEWGDISNTYTYRIGLGNYQAEKLEGGSLSELWRANLYSSLRSRYTLWQSKFTEKSEYKAHRYSPIPIKPGLTFDTKLSAAYFAYEDGNSQEIFSLTGGPSLTLGSFSKPFFDYTKISVFSGASIKQGTSPFSFDEVVDLATLGIGLSQQIAGPLVLNGGIELNIDGGSEYYGKTINSNIELRWQRRSYDLGIFYSPYKGLGGISFHLNDFNFSGNGIPFVPIASH